MYEHVVWDFDGTLFDTYHTMASSFQQMLAQYGHDEPFESIYASMKISMGHAMQAYREKYDFDDDFLAQYEKQRSLDESKYCKPFAGIPEICKRLSANHRYNYLFTHRGHSSIEFLKSNLLYDDFRECITSQDHFKRKPSPQALLYLIEKYDLPREKVLMIGDRDLDILAGIHANIDTCFFDETGKTFSQATFCVQSISELNSRLFD